MVYYVFKKISLYLFSSANVKEKNIKAFCNIFQNFTLDKRCMLGSHFENLADKKVICIKEERLSLETFNF